MISGRTAFDLSDGSGTDAPTLDESLLETVRAVPEVQLAEGGVDSESTTLIGAMASGDGTWSVPVDESVVRAVLAA